MSQPAITPTTTYDDGSFVRTAVQIQSNGGGSVVILDPKGQPLFLLNLFAFDQSANVDVIPIGRYQTLRALAWHQGADILDQTMPAGVLVAVEAH